MADKPTPTEPDTSANLSKSFADRLTFPTDSTKTTKGTNPNASTFTPSGKFSWADEVTTPTQESEEKVEDTSTPSKSQAAKTDDSSLDMAQTDGSTTFTGGSGGLEEPEFDVNVKLADLQEDPNNPLYSAKSFSDLQLPDELLRGLASMNFRKPSKIQERALPLLLKNPPSNLIGQSQSGTGKTAAFTLNMLSRIDLKVKNPQCLVLAPTRELAKQIAGVVTLMGTFLMDQGLEISEAVPQSVPRGQQLLGQIVVGTPGTTMDMIKRRQIDVRAMKVLTLDEADNMLDQQGMGDQCQRVKNLLPKTVQVVLFSATFPPEVLDFASRFAPKANELRLEVQNLTVKGIKQFYLDCSNDQEKYNALVKFYGLMTIASSIIFVHRRDTAAEIERRMTAEGHKVAMLSGALEGEERDRVFSRFRSGEAKVLITTNVLARGIDVQTVTMVINYDIPETFGGRPDYETYLHRIGRTGRFGRTGAALSFVHDPKSWNNLMAICKHFGTEPTRLETDDWDAVEKKLKAVMKNQRNAGPVTAADASAAEPPVQSEEPMAD
ncbi:RNA helicase required for poly(A+) mRNA export [Friedmanniomyces endolithicus]|uniref:RNA helicase n=1 Tax=Rachicladosporium monterosium TaxID=1507873 RepID=A0ABR0L3D6_9PEZI|nr:RNA helicase required for poly(A+) mRNA export [Friedmanniomyces endolithicus]KAK1084897.1 RNA helicase required for poly(A+) mRNA export [Friedmanniomyces endolithicus]KAK5142894.1 RNA helicase required for poly(A+) mRNA export [Rachicladosporium monterosium]